MLMIFGISILQSPRNVYSGLCNLQKIVNLRSVFVIGLEEKRFGDMMKIGMNVGLSLNQCRIKLVFGPLANQLFSHFLGPSRLFFLFFEGPQTFRVLGRLQPGQPIGKLGIASNRFKKLFFLNYNQSFCQLTLQKSSFKSNLEILFFGSPRKCDSLKVH